MCAHARCVVFWVAGVCCVALRLPGRGGLPTRLVSSRCVTKGPVRGLYCTPAHVLPNVLLGPCLCCTPVTCNLLRAQARHASATNPVCVCVCVRARACILCVCALHNMGVSVWHTRNGARGYGRHAGEPPFGWPFDWPCPSTSRIHCPLFDWPCPRYIHHTHTHTHCTSTMPTHTNFV